MNFYALSQYVNGFSMKENKLENFLKTVPASAYCKDKKGHYLEVNDIFIYTNSSVSSSDILGKIDSELSWHNEAADMMKNDQNVVSTGHSETYVESAFCFDNKLRSFLSHKVPLLNHSGKIIGTLGASFLLDDAKTVCSWLKQSGFSIKVKSLNSTDDKQHIELTPRQLECLFLLIKGMTHKQIAKELKLSPKTIEHYLDATKSKLHCRTRGELIAKALQIPIIRDKF